MARTKPYGVKNSKQRLSDLIRANQTPPLTPLVVFDFTDLGPGNLPVDGATSIKARAYTTDRDDLPRTIQYKRLSVDVLHELPVGELVPFANFETPTTFHAILDKFNEATGLLLEPHEVVNTDIDEIPEEGITITITDTSLAWLPGEYFFRYAPGATSTYPAKRGAGAGFPTDHLGRLRIKERIPQ